LAGEKEESEKRRVVRAALYEGPRKADETLAQYSLRRDSQFAMASQFVDIPDDLKAFMLEEQAGLSRQNLQNLRVLTGGEQSFTKVVRALQVLDVDDEPIMKSKGQSYLEENQGTSYFLEDDDASEDDDDFEEVEIHAFLYQVQQKDFNEEQALSFLADWEGKRKRTWAENKALKNARKKDRRHFEDSSSRSVRPTGFKRKLPIAELKKITRCANCGMKGHWKEDCTSPFKPKNDKKEVAANAFVFLGGHSSSLTRTGTSHATWLNFFNFLAVPPGCAIIDPGASQDLIGKNAFEKLSAELQKCGLQPVILKEPPPAASGIGGSAKPLFVALTPCFLGGFPGIVRLVVINEDVPQLLSIGLLEHAGAMIDTKKNKITFQNFDVQTEMARLDSGHRILNIVQGARHFDIPPQVLADYGLEPDAFHFKHPIISEAYMAAQSVLFEVFSCSEFGIKLFCGSESFEKKALAVDPGVFVSVGSVSAGTCTLMCSDVRYDQMCFETNVGSNGSDGIGNRNDQTCLKTNASLNCQSVTDHEKFSNLEDAHMGFTFVLVSEQPVVDFGLGRKTEVIERLVVESKFESKNSSRNLRRPSRPLMLSFLLLCFFNSFLVSHGIHHAPTTGSWSEEAKPDGARVPPVQVVFDDVKAATHDSGYVQPEVDASHGRELLTPKGISGSWGQPIWPLGQVHSLPGEVGLRPILRAQPKDPGQEASSYDYASGRRPSCQEQGAGWLCEGVSQDSQESGVRDSTGDEVLDERAISADHLESRSGIGSHAAGIADDAAANDDGAAITCQRVPCSRKPDANPASSSSRPDRERQLGRRHGEPQRVGDSTRQLSSLASHVPYNSEASEDLELSLQHWFVLPFWAAQKVESFRSSDFRFCWNPVGSVDVFCVWHSPQLFVSLMAANDLDDREFQVPKHVKKQLAVQISSLWTERSQGSLTNSPVILSGLLGAEETQGLQKAEAKQEQENNAEETLKLQEAKTLQKQKNSAVETPELQEAKAHPRLGNFNMIKTRMEKIFLGNWLGISTMGPGSGLPSQLPLLPRPMAMESKKYKICELFSVPRLSQLTEFQKSEQVTCTTPPNFDKKTGWDFFDARDRAEFWKVMREQEPDLVTMSPECRPFSVLMNSNWNRMNQADVLRIQTEGLAMWHFCIQVAEFQLEHGRHFWIEQPAGASSMTTHSMKWLLEQLEVYLVFFDQCASGLSVSPEGLSRKSSACVSNHPGLLHEMSKLKCAGDHVHVPLQGGLPAKAQEYPVGLLRAMLKGILLTLDRNDKKHHSYGEFDEDEEQRLGGEEDPDDEDLGFRLRAPQTPSPAITRPVLVTQKQKELIHKLHANLGHLPVDQMLTLLKAAGALDSVRKFVKEEFKCNQCMRQQRPIPHKKATFPKTFSFNHIVGIDFFYVSFLGKTRAFLNAVCQGTNLQLVALLPNYSGGPPNSKDAWILFSKTWIAAYGLPQVILCDQGSEFKGHFERALEQAGVLQTVTDSAAPWQNGRVERHGSWLKTRLEEEVQSGQSIIQSSAELEALAHMVVSHKNR